jgi:hypothetical protein
MGIVEFRSMSSKLDGARVHSGMRMSGCGGFTAGARAEGEATLQMQKVDLVPAPATCTFWKWTRMQAGGASRHNSSDHKTGLLTDAYSIFHEAQAALALR